MMYSRAAQVFRSIAKTQLEKLTEEQLKVRSEALTTIQTNIAFCMLKKKLPEKAIKAAESALEADPGNFKAYMRIG